MTEIKWKEGKNVTQTTIKKKQKKGNNAGKFISKVVKADSFFNFFDPVEINKDLGIGCELDVSWIYFLHFGCHLFFLVSFFI